MPTSTQTVFFRAVRHHIHDAFVSLLDRIDEFEIGSVLVYNEKPHFWRKKELNFTGVTLKYVFGDGAGNDFQFNTESKLLFDDTQDSSQRTVDIDLDLDGEMKVAFVELGGDVGGGGKKLVKLNVSLGAVNHITSNMFQAVGEKSFTFDLNHPVMREAVAKGKSIFVISSIYQSKKVEITISREEDISADAKENEGQDGATGSSTKPTAESGLKETGKKVEDAVEGLADKEIGIPKESLTANVKAETTGITVTKREQLSNIAFSVMKIDIGKDGSLTPQAKIGIPFHHTIHANFADAFADISKKQPTEAGASADNKKSDEKKKDDQPLEETKPAAEKKDEVKTTEDAATTATDTATKEDKEQ